MRRLRSFFVTPVQDVFACLEHVMAGPQPGKATILMVISLLVTWVVYVPIHELLHVLGCVATGGTVSELQVDWKYGGAILAKLFPFVKVGGEYAGRLTGFDTKGSDWVYFATDFMPFLLTVLIGVPLILVCRGRRRPILFGAAIVVGLAPIYQLPGDYYEMGSILTTRILTTLAGGGPIVFESIRSDDVFRLFGEVFANAAELGMGTSRSLIVGLLLILVCFAMGTILACCTYLLGRFFGLLILPKPDASRERLVAARKISKT